MLPGGLEPLLVRGGLRSATVLGRELLQLLVLLLVLGPELDPKQPRREREREFAFCWSGAVVSEGPAWSSGGGASGRASPSCRTYLVGFLLSMGVFRWCGAASASEPRFQNFWIEVEGAPVRDGGWLRWRRWWHWEEDKTSITTTSLLGSAPLPGPPCNPRTAERTCTRTRTHRERDGESVSR